MELYSRETILFSGSISDNILFGKPEASAEEVEDAARRAGAYEFIKDIPERFNFRIGEKGFNLSGGQRQRIALARTLIRNPAILILDEATSSLDQKSEAMVYETIARNRRNCTTLIIAHRLSTITWVDRIIVLKDGMIYESGTHDELMAIKGLYRKLFEAQSELETQSAVSPRQ